MLPSVVVKRDKDGCISSNIDDNFPNIFPENRQNLVQTKNYMDFYNQGLPKKLPMNMVISNTVYRNKTPAINSNVKLDDIDLSCYDHIFEKKFSPSEIVTGIRNSLKSKKRKVKSNPSVDNAKMLQRTKAKAVNAFKAETLVRHLEFKGKDNYININSDIGNNSYPPLSSEYPFLEVKGKHKEINYKESVDESNIVESNGLEIIKYF